MGTIILFDMIINASLDSAVKVPLTLLITLTPALIATRIILLLKATIGQSLLSEQFIPIEITSQYFCGADDRTLCSRVLISPFEQRSCHKLAFCNHKFQHLVTDYL